MNFKIYDFQKISLKKFTDLKKKLIAFESKSQILQEVHAFFEKDYMNLRTTKLISCRLLATGTNDPRTVRFASRLRQRPTTRMWQQIRLSRAVESAFFEARRKHSQQWESNRRPTSYSTSSQPSRLALSHA